MAEALGFGRRRLIDRIIKEQWGCDPENAKLNHNEILFLIQEMLSQEGKNYLEARDSGSNRGFYKFRNLVKMMMYRNLANYDSMILLTGDKGTGKSSKAIIMGREWCKLMGIRFNPERHIAYTNADVMRKIDTLNKFEPLICVTAATKIKVRINGKETVRQINQLVGRKDFEVLSYNKNKDIFEYMKPKKCIETSKFAEVYEIELEDGKKVRATEDHKFLLKNGEYKKLKDLKEGDDIVIYSKKCDLCKKEYEPKSNNDKYCSRKCKRNVDSIKQKEFRKNNPELAKEKASINYINRIEKNRKNALERYHRLKDNKDFKKRKKESYARHYIKNKEKLDKQNKEYYYKYHEKNLKQRKKYRDSDRGKELRKEWESENRDRVRENVCMGKKQNPNILIAALLRSKLKTALHVKRMTKKYREYSKNLFGCTIEELKEYFEKQFKDGMTWDNHTYYGWHVDHFIPCCNYNLSIEEEQKKCFHYSNLRPVWREENQSKGSKVISNDGK